MSYDEVEVGLFSLQGTVSVSRRETSKFRSVMTMKDGGIANLRRVKKVSLAIFWGGLMDVMQVGDVLEYSGEAQRQSIGDVLGDGEGESGEEEDRMLGDKVDVVLHACPRRLLQHFLLVLPPFPPDVAGVSGVPFVCSPPLSIVLGDQGSVGLRSLLALGHFPITLYLSESSALDFLLMLLDEFGSKVDHFESFCCLLQLMGRHGGRHGDLTKSRRLFRFCISVRYSNASACRLEH